MLLYCRPTKYQTTVDNPSSVFLHCKICTWHFYAGWRQSTHSLYIIESKQIKVKQCHIPSAQMAVALPYVIFNHPNLASLLIIAYAV